VTTTLLIGTACEPVQELAAALDAELLDVPDVAVPGTDWAWSEPLEAWRRSTEAGPAVGSVVVAPWTSDVGDAAALAGLTVDGWVARHEAPFARWFAAMGVAAARCADHGAIVAVVEQPAPLDCAGWAAETGLSEAVGALARSLARSEGPRGVRVNTVTTPTRLTRSPVGPPPPPLATFPGTVSVEVAGAVRALLGDGGAGITASTVHADAGRTGH
jgi:hypothetical protein